MRKINEEGKDGLQEIGRNREGKKVGEGSLLIHQVSYPFSCYGLNFSMSFTCRRKFALNVSLTLCAFIRIKQSSRFVQLGCERGLPYCKKFPRRRARSTQTGRSVKIRKKKTAADVKSFLAEPSILQPRQGKCTKCVILTHNGQICVST